MAGTKLVRMVALAILTSVALVLSGCPDIPDIGTGEIEEGQSEVEEVEDPDDEDGDCEEEEEDDPCDDPDEDDDPCDDPDEDDDPCDDPDEDDDPCDDPDEDDEFDEFDECEELLDLCTMECEELDDPECFDWCFMEFEECVGGFEDDDPFDECEELAFECEMLENEAWECMEWLADDPECLELLELSDLCWMDVDACLGDWDDEEPPPEER